MSNTVDERVVKMQFDNSSFEKGVQTTLSTLSKLKDALHFDKVDMSSISSNIEKITDKVTSMGSVWENVCQRMINKAVDVGQNIAKAFVFDPPSTGFNEYELKMNSLKVIMESSHESLETVNKYLNELNTYSDKTIYSFSDMTSSIGKFTNAGVDLDTAVKAIQGIANEAALAGANTNDASRAMYNFAQALSAGSVKLIDWKSIENANMATKDFKEELIKTAVELGTLKKSGDDYISTTTNMQGKTSEAFNATKGFNDSLAHQWMTTDVLTTTLGRYADETTEIGARATKAATEVRTFSAMMDALKEAVGSGWAQTWEIVFGNMEEATELWTSINNVLSGFIDRFSDARNTVLQGWKDLGGRAKLIEGLANVFKIFGNVLQPLKDAITLIFPPITGKTLADITEKFANFTEKVREATEFFPMKLFGYKEMSSYEAGSKKIGDILVNATNAGKSFLDMAKDSEKAANQTVSDFSKIREAAKDVIMGKYGNDSARKDALKEAGFDPEKVQEYVDKVHELSNGTWDLSDKTLDEVEKSLGSVEKASDGAAEASDKAKDAVEETAEAVEKSATAEEKAAADAQRAMNEWRNKTIDITEAGNLFTLSIAKGLSGVINIFKSAGKIVGAFGRAWHDSFSGVTLTMDHLIALDDAMSGFVDRMKIGEDTVNKFYDAFKQVFNVVKTARDSIIKLAITAFPILLNALSTVITVGGNVVRVVIDIVSAIFEFINRTRIVQNTFSALSFVLKEVGSALVFVLRVIGYLSGVMSKAISYVVNYVRNFHTMEFLGARVAGSFSKLADAYDNLKKRFTNKLGFTNFDEFAEKADKVVEKLKGIVLPAFHDFMDLLNGFGRGKTANNLESIFSSKKNKNGVLESVFSMEKEDRSKSKIIMFFDNARDTIHGAIDKLFPKKKEENNISRFLGIPEGGKFEKTAESPVAKIINILKNLKANLSKVNIGEAIKNAFTFVRDKFIPNAIQKVCDALGQFEMFVAKLDFNKVLLAAKTLRTIVKIFNGIKLAKSFSGMADSIGGFFDKAGGKFGGKAESKTTSFLKIAASLFLVAKAISEIASIPADRLDSAVGVVAGIAAVMVAITIAFMKIKPKKKADLKGASKYATSMAIALWIVAKAIVNIAKIPKEQLSEASKTIAITVGVLVAATIALSKVKTMSKSAVAAPIGFAIALRLLANTIAKLGKIPEDQLKQGEKNIWKIGLALVLAMHVIGKGQYNAASVFAPLAFAFAIFILAKRLVALSKVPVERLIKGGIVLKFMENMLKSAMKSLDGLDIKAVAAPLAFAAGIYILGRTVAKLGELEITTLAKGLVAVGLIGLILVGCMKLLQKAVGDKGFDKTALAGLVVMAISIRILGATVAKLGDLEVGQLFKGVIAVGAIGAILAGVMYLLSKYSTAIDPTVIGGLIAVTAAIVVLALTAALIGFVDLGNLAKGVIAIGFLSFIITSAATRLCGVVIPPSAIAALIVSTAMIVVLALTATAIGIMPLPILAKGVGVIAAIAAILTLSERFLASAAIPVSTIFGLIVTTLAIVTLCAIAVTLGAIPKKMLIKGTAVIAIIGAMLALAVYAIGKAKIEPTDIAAVIVLVLGIQALCFSVLSMGVLPIPVLAKGLIVVGLIATIIAASLKVISSCSFNVADVVAPLILVAAIIALAFTVKELGSLDIGTLAKGLVAVGLILGGLVLALKELSVIMPQLMLISGAVPGLLAFAAVVAILAIVAKQLGGMGNGEFAKGLGGLAVIITGLVVAFRLLATVAPQMIMIGAAFVLFGVGATLLGDAVIKVATAMVIFTQALMMFTALRTDEQLSGLSVGIMVFSGVLILLIGIIVGFVAVLVMMPTLAGPLLIFAVSLLMIGTGVYMLVAAIEKFIGISGQIGGAILAAVSSIVENAGKILEVVKNAIVGAINFIIENAPMFIAAAATMITNLVAGIREHGPEIAAKVGEFIGKALAWIKDHLPAWIEAGKNLLSKVAHGIATYGPKVVAKVGEFIGKALRWIISNLPKWLAAGKQLLTKVIAGLAAMGSKLKEKAKELVSKAKEALLEKLDEWKEAGKNLISGLISGIADKAHDLVEKAKGVVGDAIAAAKNLLKINSPSKVFRGFGRSIDEGLIVGMNDMSDKVVAASEFVTNGVIDAAKGPLDHLADLLSGDIIDDPTITPVLDLSEIQNGANQLYSMMDEADRLSFSGNVDLANAASLSVSRDQQRKRESDNQMMGSLIDAINGLAGLIGNTGNVYNVNGVTYDDGSNVSTAVRSLIRAAKIEGRA